MDNATIHKSEETKQFLEIHPEITPFYLPGYSPHLNISREQQDQVEGLNIKLEGVSKVYQRGESKVRALNNVSLDVKNGEFIAIQGPSGSGKSTLLHIIGLLDSPTSGKVLFNGKDVSRLTSSERSRVRREKIGFVFQFFYLLPTLSALENVELPMCIAGMSKKERRSRAIKLLDMVGLSHRIDHRPSELSGGERQKVAIARAVANNPSLILADEPTGNIDSKSGEKIMNILKELNRRGRTIILVTHNPKIANMAKRVLQLADGKII